jgi:tRNA A-37 threonylcarbamoyl transferase component Bud32
VTDEVVAGRYELIELVGRGGMSSVYKARDSLLERNVALKILHEHHSSDEEFVERFRREARSVAQLSHPNIVTVIDRGEDGGRQFIVFEFVEGESLKQFVDRTGRLDCRTAVELTIEIARALGFAHQQGLVHRDVKPQNVLMNGDGKPKVTDFGIARSLDVDGVTQTGTVLGTSNYLAPEQAAGDVVSAQTDVYSLGVVLYELLTGDVPFHGDNFVAVAMKHMQERPRDVRELRPEAPPRLAAVVARALEKDPRDRYASMEDLCGELAACLDDLEPEADADATMIVAPVPGERRAAATPPARRRSPRRRLPIGPLLALLLLLVAAALIAAYFATRDSSGKPRPRGGGVVPNAKPVHLKGVAAFDPPPGDGHEHDEEVARATDGSRSTFWQTEHYQSFAKPGVGLVLDAGRTTKLGALTVYTDTPGFTALVKAGSSPTDFSPVSPPRAVNGTTRFVLDGADARYYLLWITKLPDVVDSAHVNEVRSG